MEDVRARNIDETILAGDIGEKEGDPGLFDAFKISSTLKITPVNMVTLLQ